MDVEGKKMRREWGKTYTIRNSPTHTSNQNHTPAIPKPNHLPRHRLRSHKDPRNVNTHHIIAILRRILQSRRLLLNPCSGNQAIQAAVFDGDFLDDGI